MGCSLTRAAAYYSTMRTMFALFALALSACSGRHDGLTYEDISKRDATIAELSDKNTDLEKRVQVLEMQYKLQRAASEDDRRASQMEKAAAAKRGVIDDIVADKRFSDIESDTASR